MKRQISNQLLAPTVLTLVSKTKISYWSYSQSFQELFDGTLGDWITDPVSFELKGGAKPYDGRVYPGPKSYKETTIIERNRLVTLGVVEFQPGLKWASPSFIIPKKDGTVCMITNFREGK